MAWVIGYAQVEMGTKDSWIWFFQLLVKVIELVNQYGFTFIRDKHKGLVEAFEAVVPNCCHRFCARHISTNFSLVYKGKMLKDAMWRVAFATTILEFRRAMEVLRTLDGEAYKWLTACEGKWTNGKEHISLKYYLLCSGRATVWSVGSYDLLEAMDIGLEVCWSWGRDLMELHTKCSTFYLRKKEAARKKKHFSKLDKYEAEMERKNQLREKAKQRAKVLKEKRDKKKAEVAATYAVDSSNPTGVVRKRAERNNTRCNNCASVQESQSGV
ncbi:hypothetical protein GBA52_003916 [Prunus armeniaca]|nr:hypothetical protein GBA52_003916 [Prunus armeniaca]